MGTDLTLSSADSRALTEQIAGQIGEAARQSVIAIVDNESGVRASLARLVSVSGYRVELFTSAEEFQCAVPISKATCLIVGFNLGGMSGRELARWLSAAGYDLPIIFVADAAHDTVRSQ